MSQIHSHTLSERELILFISAGKMVIIMKNKKESKEIINETQSIKNGIENMHLIIQVKNRKESNKMISCSFVLIISSLGIDNIKQYSTRYSYLFLKIYISTINMSGLVFTIQ